MRCDIYTPKQAGVKPVSIHTPTWGVTLLVFKAVIFFLVSIHTPTWGVTKNRWNPPVCTDVSIHTPTWGVTIGRFISIIKKAFQSTHLHEVWQGNWRVKIATYSFNPHTYMRCDSKWRHNRKHLAVSIHTPTWGVTLCWITYYQPASLINYYANRYYFFDFTTQNCSINKLIYWFLTPAKLLFFL